LKPEPKRSTTSAPATAVASATWWDAENKVVWLCGYGWHESGADDDGFQLQAADRGRTDQAHAGRHREIRRGQGVAAREPAARVGGRTPRGGARGCRRGESVDGRGVAPLETPRRSSSPCSEARSTRSTRCASPSFPRQSSVSGSWRSASPPVSSTMPSTRFATRSGTGRPEPFEIGPSGRPRRESARSAPRLTGKERGAGRSCRESRARKLHKRLHTYRTHDEEQVVLNEKSP